MTTKTQSAHVPPHSPEAELGVLGSFIHSPTEVATLCNEAGISASHFYIPANRLVYIALQAICEKSGSDRVDMLSLMMELKRKGALDMVGGEANLSRIFDSATASHAAYYVEQLQAQWIRRAVIQNARQQETRAYDGDQEPEELLADVVRDAVELTTSAEPVVSPAQIHAENMAVCERAKLHGTAGYRSRWDELENLLGSYIPPEFVVVAGRPSDGKTTFALNEVLHKAEVYAMPCAIASIEMSENQLRQRLAGSIAEVNTFRGMRGQWSAEDRQKMIEAYAVLEKLPIYINDRLSNFTQTQSWFINVHARYGVRFFVVDYLQLMSETAADKYRTRNEFIGSLSAGFKRLSKRLQSIVMALSQESRGSHRDKTKTPPLPTLEALRDSGQIEQDADRVIMLSKRPGMDISSNYRMDQDWEMVADLAKSRNGPTGDIPMWFQRTVQKFIDQREYDRLCISRQQFPNE